MIDFWQPGKAGWYDNWWLDAEGNRIRFDPQVTQLGGKDYVPLTPDSRFADAGTPQSYLKDPRVANALDKMPDAFRQDANGQWYLSRDAQDTLSDALGVRADNTQGFWNGPGPMLLAASMFAGPVIAAGGAGAGGLPADAIGGVGGAADAAWGVNPQEFTGNLGDIINPQSTFAQNLAPNFPGAQTALSGAPGAAAVGAGGANIANYSALNTLLNQFGLPSVPNVNGGTSGSGTGGVIPGGATSSIWGPIATIGSSIVSGLLQSNAARNAAETASGAQIGASQAGIGELRRQFDAIQALLKPYSDAGPGALRGQQDLIGLNGPQAQQTAITGLEGSPAFTSLTKQGESALLQNASATGGLRGGNLEGALAKFRPQLLAQLIDRQYSNLGGITSLGQNAAAGVGNAGMNTGTNIANLLQQQGAAQAGNALARGNADARLYGGIANGVGTAAGLGVFDKLPSLNLF